MLRSRATTCALQAKDVQVAAGWAVDRFAELPQDGWEHPAPDWTQRRTLDHMIDALELYAASVRVRARSRLSPPRNGDPSATREDLLDGLTKSAERLTELLARMTDDERAFHPSGLADPSGWVGMACTELLVHTRDVVGPHPNDRMMEPLAAAVVSRVLPWAPPGDGWAQLLQATGRASLGECPPADADWWWQSAPLSEWDGRPRRRNAPPQWR